MLAELTITVAILNIKEQEVLDYCSSGSPTITLYKVRRKKVTGNCEVIANTEAERSPVRADPVFRVNKNENFQKSGVTRAS